MDPETNGTEYRLLNAEDYPVMALLRAGAHVPAQAVLRTARGNHNAVCLATKLIEAAVTHRGVMDPQGKPVAPARTRKGSFLRRILVVGGDDRPRLFTARLVGCKYPFGVLCNNYPDCANPEEPFQSPYGKRSAPVEMCGACRKARGKSPRFKEMLAARNRSRARLTAPGAGRKGERDAG